MTKLSGYAGEVLRIDLTQGASRTVPLSRELAEDFIGGRGFNSKALYDEVPACADPLGPENRLFIGTGPLVGTSFPTACRFNASAKSPQTGILGDSNAGGHFAPEVKYAGYDQIVLEGRSPRPVYIIIRDNEVTLHDASHLIGLDTYARDAVIRSDLGDKRIQTLLCGPAAESGVRYAGLYANLVRAAARTGMGTVMASKNVKAIAVRGTGSISIHNPRRFEKIVEEVTEEVRTHPQYTGRRKMGTTRILMMGNTMGFLPTRNYTTGVYEHAAEVSGERLAAEFNVKNRACFACTIPCSRVFTVKEGPYSGLTAEGPEYEALGSFTSRIGNPDISLALRANDMCNRLGLDALSTASCIAWAMELHERGLLSSAEADGLDLSWGNAEAIIALIGKIARREGFGDLLADGSRVAAEKLGRGAAYAMQVKNLDLIMADPRALKGFGLGYCVSSRGGDHLRSEPFAELSDDPTVGERMFGLPGATLRLSDEGKGKLIAYFEDWCAVIDALEPCKNIMQNMEILTFERTSDVLEAATGLILTPAQVREVGGRIVSIERAFGVREGISRRDDSLPRRFREEPLPEGASAGAVFAQERILDDYYAERGWDKHTGLPTRASLEALGLVRVANELAEMGKLSSQEKDFTSSASR